MVKGYSSESDESSDKWRWDGRAWWHKVECKGRVEFALEAQSVQGGECGFGGDSRKWRAGLTQLKARIDWLQRGGQSKTWTSGASGSVQGHGLFRGR